MKRIYRFLTIGLVLVVLGAGYFYEFNDFDRVLNSIKYVTKLSYIPFENSSNIQCDKANDSVPILTSSRFHLITWNVHKGQDKGWQEGFRRTL